MPWNDEVQAIQAQANVASTQSNPKPSAFPEWDAKGRDEVLAEWEARQQLLARAKESEMSFRKYTVDRAFPNPTEGTNTVELNNGFKLKANIKFNYRLADNDTVEAGLDELSHIGNEGAFIADRLVSWTPNFLLTEYRVIQENANKGSPDAKAMLKTIAKFLTIDDAAPSLEIKAPKSKDK